MHAACPSVKCKRRTEGEKALTHLLGLPGWLPDRLAGLLLLAGLEDT